MPLQERTAVATFVGTDTAVVTWPAIVGPFVVGASAPILPAGDPPVNIWMTDKLATGITVKASAAFTGEIDVTAFAA